MLAESFRLLGLELVAPPELCLNEGADGELLPDSIGPTSAAGVVPAIARGVRSVAWLPAPQRRTAAPATCLPLIRHPF